MATILSTKILPEADIAFARSLGLDIQCVNFIKIDPIEFHIPELVFDSVVFTSANAVQHFFTNPGALEFIKAKQIYALNGKTADQLEPYPLQIIWSGKNAEEVVDTIIRSGKTKSILHVCGSLALDTVETRVKAMFIEYQSLVVYSTEIKKDIILEGIFDAVLFYSPSGAESFFAGNTPDAKTIYCCIGETTAESVKKLSTGGKIITALQRTPVSMIETLADYLKRK